MRWSKELNEKRDSKEVRNLKMQYAREMSEALHKYDEGEIDYYKLLNIRSDRANHLSSKSPLDNDYNPQFRNYAYNIEFADFLKHVALGDEIAKRHTQYLEKSESLIL